MATLNIKNFPDDLHRKLRARAARDRRSMAQEVVLLLSASVDEGPAASILALRGLGAEHAVGVDVAQFVDEERDSWT